VERNIKLGGQRKGGHWNDLEATKGEQEDCKLKRTTISHSKTGDNPRIAAGDIFDNLKVQPTSRAFCAESGSVARNIKKQAPNQDRT